MGAGVIAVIHVKEKHIVDAFRRAGATAAGSAVAPGSISVAEREAFRRLKDRAVLREASPGAFYLDEPSWRGMRAFRRRVALVGLALVLAAAAVWWRAS